MEAVAGLLVMLLGVAHGVETSCDGRQDGTQCYGALGGTVVVQLMDSISGIDSVSALFCMCVCVFPSAPVSSVQLVSECLSQGEMRVSCSSEGGESPQYSWTLDGHTLTDTKLL